MLDAEYDPPDVDRQDLIDGRHMDFSDADHGEGIPALLTRQSRRPNHSKVRSTNALTSASSATSARTKRTPICFSRARPSSARRPAITTLAPSRTKALAI